MPKLVVSFADHRRSLSHQQGSDFLSAANAAPRPHLSGKGEPQMSANEQDEDMTFFLEKITHGDCRSGTAWNRINVHHILRINFVIQYFLLHCPIPITPRALRLCGCDCELSSRTTQNWQLPFCAFLSCILTGQVVKSTQHLGCHQRHLFLPIPSLKDAAVEAVEVANVSNSEVTATSDSVKSNSRFLCRPVHSFACLYRRIN